MNLAHGGFVGILRLGNSRFRLFGGVPNSFAAKLRSDGDDTVPINLIQGWFDDYFDVDARIASAKWTVVLLHSPSHLRRIDARVICISAANRNLHRRYGADRASLFFLRPDGHIAFVASPDRLAEFRKYLSRFYVEQDVAVAHAASAMG